MIARSNRAAAAVLALGFLLSGVGDALGAHHCPHHDGAAAEPSSRAPAATPDAAHDHSADTGEGSHGPCTCVGRCHAGAAPSLPGPVLGHALPVPAAPASTFRAPEPLFRQALVPFALPWGNAPPTL